VLNNPAQNGAKLVVYRLASNGSGESKGGVVSVKQRKNDVKRGGWSAHKLSDESSYAIDMKQKLKQGDVDRDDDALITPDARTVAPPDVARTSHSETKASRKQSSKTRRVR